MLTEVNEYDAEKYDKNIVKPQSFYNKILNILTYPLRLLYEKRIVGYFLNGIVWRSGYVKPSSYKLDNFKLDIEYLQKNHNNDYLLCISYHEGDTQIGITGTVKINENPNDTAIRELHEETTNLLSLDKKCVIDYGMVDVKLELNQLDSIIDSENRSIYRFTFNVDEDTLVQSINIPSNTNEDIIDQKVCVYIHGTKEILQKKFWHFNEYDPNKETGVKEICIIAIKDLYDML